MHVSSVYQISSGCFRIIRYILGIITVTAICISLQVVTQFSRVIVTKMTCLSLDGKCVHITQLQPQLSWLIVPYIDVNKMHGCMHITQLQSLSLLQLGMMLVIYCCHFSGLVFVSASHTLWEAMAGCSRTGPVPTSRLALDGSRRVIDYHSFIKQWQHSTFFAM